MPVPYNKRRSQILNTVRYMQSCIEERLTKHLQLKINDLIDENNKQTNQQASKVYYVNGIILIHSAPIQNKKISTCIVAPSLEIEFIKITQLQKELREKYTQSIAYELTLFLHEINSIQDILKFFPSNLFQIDRLKSLYTVKSNQQLSPSMEYLQKKYPKLWDLNKEIEVLSLIL